MSLPENTSDNNHDEDTNTVLVRVMDIISKEINPETYYKGKRVRELNPAIAKEINDIKVVFSFFDNHGKLDNEAGQERFQNDMEKNLGYSFNASEKILNKSIIVYRGMTFDRGNVEIWVRYFRPKKTFGDLSNEVLQDYRSTLKKVRAAITVSR